MGGRDETPAGEIQTRDRVPRILILPASVGAGHLRAAEAVELALRELAPDAVVRNVDVLSLATKTFCRVYGKGYLDLANKVPHVLGYFYDLFDRPKRKKGAGAKKLRLAVERLNMRPFLKLLRAEKWDIIVNTHFLPAEIVASLRRKRQVNTPHCTVTTDFETHGLWVHRPCEHYFTATEEGAIYLQHWGVPREMTSVTGVPIHPVFSRPGDRASCLAAHGLEGDRPVVLQLAGGFGVGPIEKLYRGVLSVEVPLEIVVVAGRNEKAKKKLEAIDPPSRHRAKVMGFTDKMHELMTVADVVLTKPGGLTTSEALARGAAMAVVNPIPGQESRNSDYLLENGAAIKINSVAVLPHKLTRLLRDPERLAALKENARRLGRPEAAFDVARKVLEFARRARTRTPQ